jgi:hypothetical protein
MLNNSAEIEQLFKELGRIEYELVYYSQMVETNTRTKNELMKQIDEKLYASSLSEQKKEENETDLD